MIERSFLLLNRQVTELVSPSFHLVRILSKQNTLIQVINLYNYLDKESEILDTFLLDCFKINTGMQIIHIALTKYISL